MPTLRKDRITVRHLPEESSQLRPDTNNCKQPSGTSDFETDDLRKNETAPSGLFLASHPQFTRNDSFRPFFPDTRQTAITETHPALPSRFRPGNRLPRTRPPPDPTKRRNGQLLRPPPHFPRHPSAVYDTHHRGCRPVSREETFPAPRFRSAQTKTEECAGSGTLLCFCRTSEAVTRTPRR